jgi:hypothetical protein
MCVCSCVTSPIDALDKCQLEKCRLRWVVAVGSGDHCRPNHLGSTRHWQSLAVIGTQPLPAAAASRALPCARRLVSCYASRWAPVHVPRGKRRAPLRCSIPRARCRSQGAPLALAGPEQQVPYKAGCE